MVLTIALISCIIITAFWFGVVIGVQTGRERQQKDLKAYFDRAHSYFERGTQHLKIAQGLYKEANKLCRLSFSFLQDSRSNPHNKPNWDKAADDLPDSMGKDD